jgi:hypothetical protein
MRGTSGSDEIEVATPWRAIAALFVLFWAVFYGAYLVQEPAHALIRSFTTLKSEYKVFEQLSSFYCIVIIFTALLVYGLAKDDKRIRTAIAILILGVLLFFSESNFLRKATQAACAAVAFPAVFLCLYLERAFLTLIFLGIGVIAIGAGYGIDLVIGESELVERFLPDLRATVRPFKKMVGEEASEAFGVAWICLSALVCFLPELTRFVRAYRKATLILVASLAFISVADGYLHWSYNRSTAKEVLALVPAFLGFIGLVWANRLISYPDRLRLFSEHFLYFFVFVFFIMLPVFFDNPHTLADILLWLPAMVFSAVYLYIHRGRQTRPVNETG